MKKIAILAALLAVFSCGSKNTDIPEPGPETPSGPPDKIPALVKGADISWATEMEADGRRWLKKDGSSATLTDVLKDCGFQAVRLRVWVDPYKGWSGKQDVLKVAQAVHAAGMFLMIDFHYSDFFADPNRQKMPAAWEADAGNPDKMAGHVSAHTTEVLQLLKDAGVSVQWIQIGNETRGGMLYPAGALDYNKKGAEFAGFVKLYNAGYDAAKAVYPSAFVMPHLNNAFAASDNDWWLGQFKAQGGRMDMIALSHYPQYESKVWENGKEKTLTPTEVNQRALAYIRQAAATYGVPVMVSEVGVKSQANESTAKSLLKSFMDEAVKIEKCAGVFYWEPEVDGVWKPAIYSKLPELSMLSGSQQTRAWNAYDQGAFTTAGKPTAVLDAFGN